MGQWMKRALITGITGQDGSYLSEFLLEKGYKVFGIIRKSNRSNLQRIRHIQDRLELLSADLADDESLIMALKRAEPDEIYNLAGQSFVPDSWGQPVFTGVCTALGVTKILEAIRICNPKIRFYQASTSEMFGNAVETPQTEETPFWPRNPYGVAKVYGHWISVNYREHFNIFACSGICFNHESPRRGLEFITRKVTNTVARIKLGLADVLRVGNLDSERDWGFSGDYVEAMWLMLQQERPQDYVIATGKTHSVRSLIKIAFEHVGLNWEDRVVVDQRFIRPPETNLLVGNPNKAMRVLNWMPKTSFEDMIRLMVDSDLEILKAQTNR